MIWAILRWKTLSVKVPINKEDFGFMDEFLVRWRFDFWVVKQGKCLILVGFDDMGYDKWVEGGGFGILLDFVGIFDDWGMGYFNNIKK